MPCTQWLAKLVLIGFFFFFGYRWRYRGAWSLCTHLEIHTALYHVPLDKILGSCIYNLETMWQETTNGVAWHAEHPRIVNLMELKPLGWVNRSPNNNICGHICLSRVGYPFFNRVGYHSRDPIIRIKLTTVAMIIEIYDTRSWISNYFFFLPKTSNWAHK